MFWRDISTSYVAKFAYQDGIVNVVADSVYIKASVFLVMGFSFALLFLFHL